MIATSDRALDSLYVLPQNWAMKLTSLPRLGQLTTLDIRDFPRIRSVIMTWLCRMTSFVTQALNTQAVPLESP